jgi:hypothetical protein
MVILPTGTAVSAPSDGETQTESGQAAPNTVSAIAG